MKKLSFILAILLLSGVMFAYTFTTEWKIAPKYSIAFDGGEVSGIFRTFSGKIFFDGNDLAGSRFDVTIDVNSINTGNGLQNRHAKEDDWFDAAKFPAITFVSKKIAKTGNTFQVTGDLTMHGIKKEISFPFSFQGQKFSGKFSVNRNDFKIGKPGGEVDDVISITVNVPVVK
ncbi:polyisoprenoid-binding protein [Chitinophaga caeni]|uniref:Polyisoprenoid-binding protein n=1 Tax=Chitinophaga caeni TaxID=2029983 RepID=A0A291QXT1_9BACT|nr:YceI family protein [Chitinophaga caeni]ATL48673.1 polyisoprenoid-binding protein [Chitinophaga caeni]